MGVAVLGQLSRGSCRGAAVMARTCHGAVASCDSQGGSQIVCHFCIVPLCICVACGRDGRIVPFLRGDSNLRTVFLHRTSFASSTIFSPRAPCAAFVFFRAPLALPVACFRVITSKPKVWT